MQDIRLYENRRIGTQNFCVANAPRKAGGLTVSEALACDLPIVCYDAIPGQEENNAQFLQDAGMGVYVRDGSCAQAVAALLGDRERLNAMRERCRAYDKSSCEEALAHLVARLTGRAAQAQSLSTSLAR